MKFITKIKNYFRTNELKIRLQSLIWVIFLNFQIENINYQDFQNLSERSFYFILTTPLNLVHTPHHTVSHRGERARAIQVSDTGGGGQGIGSEEGGFTRHIVPHPRGTGRV